MDRETFRDYFNVSPETYARQGWDMGRILGDLKRENGPTPGGWGEVANAAAALLEELGFGPAAPAPTLVYCTTCGTAMERRDDPHGDPGRECWLWFNLAGLVADKCPGCGAVTSALTTTVHPSTRSVLREVWDRRSTVPDVAGDVEIVIDEELAERIRVVLVHPGAHQGDDLAEIVQLLQRLTADERRLVMYAICRFAGVPVG